MDDESICMPEKEYGTIIHKLAVCWLEKLLLFVQNQALSITAHVRGSDRFKRNWISYDGNTKPDSS